MPATNSNLNLRQSSSDRQTRLLLFAGFGGLLLLMPILGVSAITALYRIELREAKIRQEYLVRDRALEGLRANIYVAGTYVRDFLLAGNDRVAAASVAQFAGKRREIESQVNHYQILVTEQSREPFQQLQKDLGAWFEILGPALEWDSEARRAKGYAFMQEQVLPRRTVVIDDADRLHEVAERDLERSSEAVGEMVAESRSQLMMLLGLIVLTGVAVAGVALWRLLRLENESAQRFGEVLKTREELKRLSAELLSAQEMERRRISRELHDEVGQVLSAISLEIGGARSALKEGNRAEVLSQLQRVQKMIESNMGVVRNIALLLRPTMLDDLGLAPALKWLAREASRSGPAEVDFVSEAFPDDLPEEHRTCIFRVVQEAVRNAARHSGARMVRIYVSPTEGGIRASVQDDGRGFDPVHEKGLGMIGMEERVLHLGGRLRIDSEPGRGTVVSFELPLPTADQVQMRPFRTA
jgi:signal transduction histidine kinase